MSDWPWPWTGVHKPMRVIALLNNLQFFFQFFRADGPSTSNRRLRVFRLRLVCLLRVVQVIWSNCAQRRELARSTFTTIPASRMQIRNALSRRWPLDTENAVLVLVSGFVIVVFVWGGESWEFVLGLASSRTEVCQSVADLGVVSLHPVLVFNLKLLLAEQLNDSTAVS